MSSVVKVTISSILYWDAISSVMKIGSEISPAHKSVIARKLNKILDGGWRDDCFFRAARIITLPRIEVIANMILRNIRNHSVGE